MQSPLAGEGFQTYQPEPDGRVYTKTNFFSQRNNSRGHNEQPISEKYQTDVEPGEQAVFNEMMQRRNRLNRQAPAVPDQQMIMYNQHYGNNPSLKN